MQEDLKPTAAREKTLCLWSWMFGGVTEKTLWSWADLSRLKGVMTVHSAIGRCLVLCR